MTDIFDQTVASYRDPAGAEAFVAKERQFMESRNPRVWKLFDEFDLTGQRVLDVGCGFGRDVAEFRRRGADAYGCDVSPALLQEALREVGPHFREWNGRTEDALPFSGSFDLIWCCAVLVHIARDDVRRFLSVLWNGLRPGGRMFLLTKCGDGEQVMTNLGEGLPRVMVYYRADEIVRILREFGAEIEVADEGHSATAFGESLLLVRARKV